LARVARARFLGWTAACAASALAGAALAAPVELAVVDGAGVRLDGGASRLGFSHAPPSRDADPAEFRVVVSASDEELPKKAKLVTLPAPDVGPRGVNLDAEDFALEPGPCPTALGGRRCALSRAIRLVPDELDRRHPVLEGRALVGELGGALTASVEGGPTVTLRVDTADGRARARLRVHLLRMTRGGSPPIGRDDVSATRLVRDEVARASALWGVCGVSFGPPAEVSVDVLDPPPSALVAVGCEGGTGAAAGGRIRLRVEGQDVSVDIAKGTSGRGAARVLAQALERRGFRATVSDNAIVHAATYATSDVLVRKKNGQLATVLAPKAGPISSDADLDVCVGSVYLEDGLTHFADADAIAGTLEERTLVKALDDGDPSTVDVFVVPSFGGDSRIGESFIFADTSAIKNVVIEDRTGFRAHRASFTLAHEIGHVLLDQPGHPDDFGVDASTSLMDADAMSPSVFGPRRLSKEECRRARIESGPTSPARVLAPWPLAPLK
jgi:hypothetical protein